MPDLARLLSPAAQTLPTRTAAFLDANTLRWPGASGDRFVLHHSAMAKLHFQAGQPIVGSDDRVELQATTLPLPAATEAAHAWRGAGPTLQVAEADRARLPALWRGQLWLVAEDAQGRALTATGVQLAAALDAHYADAAEVAPLGARFDRKQTAFGLWAPTAQSVSLCLYAGPDDDAHAILTAEFDADSGVWRTALPQDLRGQSYRWLVDVFAPATGLVRNRVTDPYSLSLSADSARSLVIDLDDPATQPPGWTHKRGRRSLPAATDMVIYELHLRDFSVGDDSVPSADRGKYRAFSHPDSHGMRHLRALAEAGLTDVHLLPVFDFATVSERDCRTPQPSGAPDGQAQQALIEAGKSDDCYNWGYDPWHYTAPEGSYASDANDGHVRVREFRQMVLALHEAGLRVGMDVVYNHTSASGQQLHSVLDRIVPGYYQRLDRAGQVERSTCCDNTATEQRMMARLMIDSAVVWARDYRIDSFRFDLMGHQPRAAMLRLQQAVDEASGRHVELLGEGWNFGEVANGARFVQASQLSLNGSGIATFSDRARDAVRGGGCCDEGLALVAGQGYVNGLHYAPNGSTEHSLDQLLAAADLIRVGLAGSLRDFVLTDRHGLSLRAEQIDYVGQPAGYVSQPGEVVNYVENHDNQTLFDSNVMKLPIDTSAAERARVQVLAMAINAFSQGIAYFHAGIDTLRSKSLDRNSYDSGDWFNRLDWSLQNNHFGVGLPPARDNAASWPWMQARLSDPSIAPDPATIAWTAAAFRDLLRIRASSGLFRLRSAEQIRARLRFPNSGATQIPTLLAGLLDGEDHPDAGYAELLYLINVDLHPITLTLPEQAGQDWVL
ncbi:MAG: DUF3372 domain-containing protein, partial [Xanthomonadales bacterium]|nr:DUF3372 domain-containing protein [Xanthomonadales bacterium]